jgi:hypothetical protein
VPIFSMSERREVIEYRQCQVSRHICHREAICVTNSPDDKKDLQKQTKQTQYNNQRVLEPCWGCDYSDLRSGSDELIMKTIVQRCNWKSYDLSVSYTNTSNQSYKDILNALWPVFLNAWICSHRSTALIYASDGSSIYSYEDSIKTRTRHI